MSSNEGKSTFESFLFAVSNTLQAPVIWFRGNVHETIYKYYSINHIIKCMIAVLNDILLFIILLYNINISYVT